jgi:zinc protease
MAGSVRAHPYNRGMAAVLPQAPGGAPVTERVLDNGLTVLVQQVRTAPLVSVWCWYRVGSGDETPGRTGISHWVEHMNFKGTTRIPADRIKGLVERYGGYWNGYTWVDQTAYTETAPRETLDHLLFIEAERMAHGLYEPAACESERTVIISELEGGENDPDELLERDLAAAAFDVHPYRHPTIGWIDDLRAMTRDDLYAHYRRHYVPANATLVVVGDVDADAALRAVEKHFGAIPAGTRPETSRPAEPAQAAERRVVVRREGTTGYVKVGMRAPAVDDPDFFPLLVADAVLTGAKGLNLWASFTVPPPQRRARLYRALVDGGLASEVRGEMMPTRDPFLYTVTLDASEDVALDEVEGAVLDELDRFAAEGPTPDETRRAQRQLRARLVFETDRVSNIAHQLGYYQTIASWRRFPELAARVDAVTMEQVAEAAARRLAPANRTVGWFDPIVPGAPA